MNNSNEKDLVLDDLNGDLNLNYPESNPEPGEKDSRVDLNVIDRDIDKLLEREKSVLLDRKHKEWSKPTFVNLNSRLTQMKENATKSFKRKIRVKLNESSTLLIQKCNLYETRFKIKKLEV